MPNVVVLIYRVLWPVRFAAKVVSVLLVLVLLFVLVTLGLAAMQGPDDAKSSCNVGPTVSTPIGTRGVNYLQRFGQWLNGLEDKDISAGDIYRTVRSAHDVWMLWTTAFSDSAKGDLEHSFVTGWKNRTSEAQQRALDACCAAGIPLQDPPPGDVPPGGVEPFDPKSAAITRGLTGPALAADALARAGFPASAIPMGVAIAKYESGFNPAARNSSDHVGLWQVSAPNARTLHLGDRTDPYVNARYAKALWDGRGGSWAQDWSTYRTASQHVDEYRQYGQGAVDAAPLPNAQAPTATQPAYCPQQQGNAGGGGGAGSWSIQQVASLNPAGAGNWQGAVHAGPYWYVSHATAGNRSQVFHRLNAAGSELDHMTGLGFAHATSFAVVGTTVYATDNSNRVLAFPYRAGGTIRPSGAVPTGWRGFISKDPGGSRVVIRNGNKYQAYDFTSHQPIGRQIVTPTGMRQGFSIAGDTVYTLSGATNQRATVDAYSVSTGEHLTTRDVTEYGAGRAREPEGLYGAMFGIKTGVGDARRLKMFSISAAPEAAPSAGTRTVDGMSIPIPGGKAGVAINYALDQVGKPYVWAAHGPNAYDCSGLTGQAWRKAGVSVPMQSDAQRRALTHVPLSQVQPGDILWHPGHVQIYLGIIGGKWTVVEAANPRAGIRVDQTKWMKPQAVLRPTTGATA